MSKWLGSHVDRDQWYQGWILLSGTVIWWSKPLLSRGGTVTKFGYGGGEGGWFSLVLGCGAWTIWPCGQVTSLNIVTFAPRNKVWGAAEVSYPARFLVLVCFFACASSAVFYSVPLVLVLFSSAVQGSPLPLHERPDLNFTFCFKGQKYGPEEASCLRVLVRSMCSCW